MSDEKTSQEVTEASEEVMEVAEEDIVGYLMDEDDNEIGIIVLDEDGNEVEMYYDESLVVEEEVVEESFEVEIDEDSVLYYLYDKKRKEVGVILLDENGKENRLLYVEEDEPAAPAKESGEAETVPVLGVSKDDMADMFSTFKDLAKSGYEAVSDIMDQVDDVRDSVDAVNPKKRREQRRLEKQAEKQAELAAKAQAKMAADQAAANVAADAAAGAAGA